MMGVDVEVVSLSQGEVHSECGRTTVRAPRGGQGVDLHLSRATTMTACHGSPMDVAMVKLMDISSDVCLCALHSARALDWACIV